MRVWIAPVGWQPFAVINPLWASCFSKRFIPEKVILLNNGFKNTRIKENVEIVKDWHKRILVEYGVEAPLIETWDADEDDINEYQSNFKNLIIMQKEHEVAIDMTPGRKFMSSIAMATAFKNREFVKKLFYLHLWGQEYQNQPFIKIPLKNQKLIDILEL
ncbi:MAG: hypothetical protein ACFFD2_06530 [Promethearchaeota archaeon]